MSILKNQTTLQRVQKQSADALGIFQTTIQKLADTNSTIEAADQEASNKIEALKREREEYSTIKTQNLAVMGKINEFFGTLIK